MDALVDGHGGDEATVLHNDRVGEEDSLLNNTAAPGKHNDLMVGQHQGHSHDGPGRGTANRIIRCHRSSPSPWPSITLVDLATYPKIT